MAFVHPSKYADYKLNPDLETANKCIELLKAEGFEAEGDANFDWIHDTYLILVRMFPGGCPPTTIISMNARYDPYYHVKVGAALRPLREQGYLLIGSGGAVHNLYRNRWEPMLRYRDSFAQQTPPEAWALEFRQSVEDIVTQTSGPRLRRGITRLMKHPQYRDAHATDDHFMSGLFVAGAVGDKEDEGTYGKLCAETWELVRASWFPLLVIRADTPLRPTCATLNSHGARLSRQRHESRAGQRGHQELDSNDEDEPIRSGHSFKRCESRQRNPRPQCGFHDGFERKHTSQQMLEHCSIDRLSQFPYSTTGRSIGMI